MPDKVSFATTNWKNKSEKPAEFTQGEWDAYNSSGFNGFPFPLLEKNQANSPFQQWDKVTKFQNKPSGSSSKLISVKGLHYSLKFTYDQLFSFFWRMKGRSLTLGTTFNDQTIDKTSSNNREQDYTLNFQNFTLVLDAEAEPKNQESKLISEPATNKWIVRINGCKIEINFNEPVLKLGEDDYRVYANCGCCEEQVGCCMYGAQDFEDELLTDSDLPAEVSIPALGINLTLSGDTYTGGQWTLERPFPDLWILSNLNGCYYDNGCLIGTYQPGYYHHDYDLSCPTSLSVEDKFANTYTLKGHIPWEEYSIMLDDSDNYTLTRTGLCEWLGDTITIPLSDYVSSGTCDVKFFLRYEDSSSNVYGPVWRINYYQSNWNVFYNEDGSPVPEQGATIKHKGSPEMSSPIGLYEQGNGFGQWEIA